MNALTIPKRDDKRSRVFLAAAIDFDGHSMDARIRDISRNGALMEAERVPPQGQRLQVRCGQTVFQAHVVWAERGWFGVEFDTPLIVSKLVDEQGAKLKVSAPRSYRGGEPLD